MWRFTRNNGITEGFHDKMELINRQAYGFRNFENYRLRVIFSPLPISSERQQIHSAQQQSRTVYITNTGKKSGINSRCTMPRDWSLDAPNSAVKST
jgi:hypothetical protein